MDWLEEAKRIYSAEKAFEAEKKQRIRLRRMEDIPSDVDGIKSISFSSDYEGPSPVAVLHELLGKSNSIKEIGIYCKVLNWDDICSLDLTGVEEFTVVLDGAPTEARIIAESLKELVVFASAELMPLELLTTAVPEIDFSGMPNLEALELKHFQQIDPDSFSKLRYLKKLVISDSNLTDLRWLEKAEYRLEYLCITDRIVSCEGISCQSELENVCLDHALLNDVGPLLQLPTLKYLDLNNSDINDGTLLLSSGIETVLLSPADRLAEMKTESLLRDAVLVVRYEDRRTGKADEMPTGQRKYFLHRISMPFETRVQKYVCEHYRNTLKKIDEQIEKASSSDINAEYRAKFISKASEAYPFLNDLLRHR